MKFYRKTVVVVTCFFAMISGVILISGAGDPAWRIMVGAVFFISCLNLSAYLREFGQWLNRNAKTAGTHLASVGKKEEKEKGKGGKSKSRDKGRPAKGGKRPAANAPWFEDEDDEPKKSRKKAKKIRPAPVDEDFGDDDFDLDDDFDFDDDDR